MEEEPYAISTEPDPPFVLEDEGLFYEQENEKVDLGGISDTLYPTEVASSLDNNYIDEPNKNILAEEIFPVREGVSDISIVNNMNLLEQEKKEVLFFNDGITTPFFAKMVREYNPLVPHILNFNLHRAKEIHSSHYEGIGEVLFSRGFLDKILDSHRSVHYLTENREVLIGRATPKKLWYTDFENYRHRFVLLPTHILEELSLYLGITIFYQNIRETIQREGVEHMRRMFGKKAADFGVRRVSLFLHNIASIHNLFHLPLHWEIEDQVRESGRYGLGLCISTLPKILQKETALKLPRGFLSTDSDSPNSIGPEGFSDIQKKVLSERLFPLLRKILTLEVAPEWTPYFF